MTIDFCAIDFETANWQRGSPCAVGLVKVIDGRIVDTRRFLMRPPEGCDHFEPFNIRLHGITPAMVAAEPRFADRLPDILAFADGLPFVAHNAAFDMGVIRDACIESDVDWPEASYGCTLMFSRVTWQLLSYSLPWVAEAAGVVLENHHDPEADALAAAAILVAIARHHGVDSLDDLVAATKTPLGFMTADDWRGCRREWKALRRFVPTPGAQADPGHSFYDREIVFTGALSSMTRAIAWDRVAEVGGRPAVGVTKHTHILVLGYQDAVMLRPGEMLSAKAQKANALRARGQEIELMGELDFLRSLAL